jgi:hypothetical protein
MGLTSGIAIENERADERMKGTWKMTPVLTTPSQRAMIMSTNFPAKCPDAYAVTTRWAGNREHVGPISPQKLAKNLIALES